MVEGGRRKSETPLRATGVAGGCGGRVVSVLSSGSEGRGIDPRLFLPTLDVVFLDSVLFLNKV